jgi:hypothetical protein
MAVDIGRQVLILLYMHSLRTMQLCPRLHVCRWQAAHAALVLSHMHMCYLQPAWPPASSWVWIGARCSDGRQAGGSRQPCMLGG